MPKVIARVNDPRNQAHFDLLGITQTVCATSNILGLVEHEVPEHDLVHLLELRRENLEIVEVQIEPAARRAPASAIDELELPEGARLISVMRDGQRADRRRRHGVRGRATRCSRSSSRARKTSSARCPHQGAPLTRIVATGALCALARRLRRWSVRLGSDRADRTSFTPRAVVRDFYAAAVTSPAPRASPAGSTSSSRAA